MNRLLRPILVAILLITCSGCIWVHDRGEHGDYYRGQQGDQDMERHDEHEERY